MKKINKTIIAKNHKYNRETKIDYYIGFSFPFSGFGFIIDEIPTIFARERCYCITVNFIFIKSYLSFGIISR
jgi:hypothetical protein